MKTIRPRPAVAGLPRAIAAGARDEKSMGVPAKLRSGADQEMRLAARRKAAASGMKGLV